jgi:hypothetical protein
MPNKIMTYLIFLKNNESPIKITDCKSYDTPCPTINHETQTVMFKLADKFGCPMENLLYWMSDDTED